MEKEKFVLEFFANLGGVENGQKWPNRNKGLWCTKSRAVGTDPKAQGALKQTLKCSIRKESM
jgi:hypothetical protein